MKKLKLPKINLSETWYLKDWPGFASTLKNRYSSYYVTKQTRKLVQSLFPKDFFNENVKIMAQVVEHDFNDGIHKDTSRLLALNYMIDTGGQNAHVGLYDEDKKLVSTYKQVPGEWCMLETQKYHAVHKVETMRLSVTVYFKKIDQEQLEWINAQIQD